jgi:two-component system sensor histidine kinase VicK
MLDDLLNVSHINSGKYTIKKERINLRDVINRLLPLVERDIQKHIFLMNIEPGLIDIQVDRDKFTQVIGNLLSNAIKYSPSGGKVILSARYDKEHKQIIISVSDEGIGISKEDKAQLFTTFHRIKRPETQGIRGSGLGLYIAKEWIQAMGGKIWLDSELNEGSIFYISIPEDNSDNDVEDSI